MTDSGDVPVSSQPGSPRTPIMPMTSTVSRLVCVYIFDDTSAWEDMGTGQLSMTSDETTGTLSMNVRDPNGEDILDSLVSKTTTYQLQEETMIIWNDTKTTKDIALSFKEKSVCSEIWGIIWKYQDDQQAMPRDDADPLPFDQRQYSGPAVPIEVPLPALSSLTDLMQTIVHISMSQRDSLVSQLIQGNYVEKLLNIFDSVEDLEDTDSLHLLYHIFRGMIMINSKNIFEHLLSDENLFKVIGVFERDPNLPTIQPHRQFLENCAQMTEVVRFKDQDLSRMIQKNYRIQYLKNIIFPQPGGVMDDSACIALNSIVYLNNMEILQAIRSDGTAIEDLASILHDGPHTKIQNVVLFVQEMCSTAKEFHESERQSFFEALYDHGLFSVVDWCLGTGEDKMKWVAYDILDSIVIAVPSLLRQYLLTSSHKRMNKKNRSESTLFHKMIEQFVCEQEPSIKSEILEIVRALLDTSSLEGQSDKDSMLEAFYSRFLPLFIVPLTMIEEEEKGGKKRYVLRGSIGDVFIKARRERDGMLDEEIPDLSTNRVKRKRDHLEAPIVKNVTDVNLQREIESSLLQNVCDLLQFCIVSHSFHAKYFVMGNPVLPTIVTKLLFWKDASVKLSAIRLFKSMCQKDTAFSFYNRYLIQNGYFGHLIESLDENGKRYNLVNSCILDVFETVMENKTLLLHVAATYGVSLVDKHGYVDTFSRLMTRYEQLKYEDEVKIGPQLDDKMMDRDIEELYFSRDDGDVDLAPAPMPSSAPSPPPVRKTRPPSPTFFDSEPVQKWKPARAIKFSLSSSLISGSSSSSGLSSGSGSSLGSSVSSSGASVPDRPSTGASTPISTPISTLISTPISTPISTLISTPISTLISTPISTPISTKVLPFRTGVERGRMRMSRE